MSKQHQLFPDDEGWTGEILARYERGVMLLLFILAATIVGLIVWLGGISRRPID